MSDFQPYDDGRYLEQPPRQARSIETDLQDLLDLFENSKTRPLTPQPAPAAVNWGEPAPPYVAPAASQGAADDWSGDFFFDEEHR